MGRRLSSESKMYLRLVMGTFAVLIAIAVLNGLIIINSLGTEIFQPIRRNLAAVTQKDTPATTPIIAPTISVDCLDKDKKLSLVTRASNARFLFKNCKKVGRLVNKANNNHGDIFPLEKNTWTSDYISLAPGKNSVSAPLGNEEQTIEVTREVLEKTPKNKGL